MKKLDINNLNVIKNSVVAIGFFDGIHLGHQKILTKVQEIALNKNLDSVIVTFSDILLKMFKMKYTITTYAQKIKEISRYKIDYNFTINKQNKLYNLSAKEFLNFLIDKLNCRYLVCGKDLCFGNDKFGNIDFIKKNSAIEVIEVDDVIIDNIKISSSYIRTLLINGNIEKANKYLSFPFTLNGIVIKGKQIGRTIHYKTANLKVPMNSYCLKYGVYYGKVYIKKDIYYAMINIGNNPTIDNSMNLKIEANILNIDRDLYNQSIAIQLLKYHREEIKFANIEKLKEQLDIDFQGLVSFSKNCEKND